MNDKSERIAQLNDEFRKAAGTPQQTGLVFKTSNIADHFVDSVRDVVQIDETDQGTLSNFLVIRHLQTDHV